MAALVNQAPIPLGAPGVVFPVAPLLGHIQFPLAVGQPQHMPHLRQQTPVLSRHVSLGRAYLPYQTLASSPLDGTAPMDQGPLQQKDIPSQKSDDGIPASIEQISQCLLNPGRSAVGRPGPSRWRPNRNSSAKQLDNASHVAASKTFRFSEEHVQLIESTREVLASLIEAIKHEDILPSQTVFSSKYSKLHPYGAQLGVTDVPNVGLLDGAASISRLLLHRMPLSVTFGNEPKFEGSRRHGAFQTIDPPNSSEPPSADEMNGTSPSASVGDELKFEPRLTAEAPYLDEMHRIPSYGVLGSEPESKGFPGHGIAQAITPENSIESHLDEAQRMPSSENSCAPILLDELPTKQIVHREHLSPHGIHVHSIVPQESESLPSSARTLPGTPESVTGETRRLLRAEPLPSFLGKGWEASDCEEHIGSFKPASEITEAMYVAFFQELREKMSKYINTDALNTIFESSLPRATSIFINGTQLELSACGHHNDSSKARFVRPMSAIDLHTGVSVQTLLLSWPAVGIVNFEIKVDVKSDVGCWPLGTCGQMGIIRLLPIPHSSLQVSLLLWSPPATMRCMSIKDILDFFDQVPQMNSMREVVEATILPTTKDAHCSFAETNGNYGPPDVFISHSWDENISLLRQAVLELRPFLQNASGAKWMDSRAYICALTNNQHCISDELGDDFAYSSFAQALGAPSCRLFVFVGGHKLRAWLRAWCLLELAMAIDAGKHVLVSTPKGVVESGQLSLGVLEELAKRIELLDISNAQCSAQAELQEIHALVQRQFGGKSCINTLLRNRLLASVGVAIAHLKPPPALPLAIFNSHDSSMKTSYYELKLVDASDIILENEILGLGSCGAVQKGSFKGIPIAAKQLEGLELDTCFVEVSSELQRLSQLAHHPNIAGMVSFAIAMPSDILLAMELVRGVSLLDHLQSSASLVDVRRTLQGIAFGVSHLHSSLVVVVHGDLRPSNVLLDTARGYEVPRITDCGIAYLKAAGLAKKKVSVGPVQYRAPETLPQAGKLPRFSTKSDVFSYGILAWHVALRKPPWQDYGEKDIRSMLLLGDRSGIPLHSIEDVDLRSLIQSCQAQEPHQRPEMCDLLRNSWLC